MPASQANTLIKTYAASSGLAVSYKFVLNCEYRLFQRPDEAIHRGFDKDANRPTHLQIPLARKPAR